MIKNSSIAGKGISDKARKRNASQLNKDNVTLDFFISAQNISADIPFSFLPPSVGLVSVDRQAYRDHKTSENPPENSRLNRKDSRVQKLASKQVAVNPEIKVETRQQGGNHHNKGFIGLQI